MRPRDVVGAPSLTPPRPDRNSDWKLARRKSLPSSRPFRWHFHGNSTRVPRFIRRSERERRWRSPQHPQSGFKVICIAEATSIMCHRDGRHVLQILLFQIITGMINVITAPQDGSVHHPSIHEPIPQSYQTRR